MEMEVREVYELLGKQGFRVQEGVKGAENRVELWSGNPSPGKGAPPRPAFPPASAPSMPPGFLPKEKAAGVSPRGPGSCFYPEQEEQRGGLLYHPVR